MKPVIQWLKTWWKEQQKGHEKEYKKAAIWGMGVLLVIGVVWMSTGNRDARESDYEGTTEEAAQEICMAESVLPVLDKDQKAILDAIIQNLQEDNLQEAAAWMLENEQKLQYLFYQVLEGETYLYRDGKLLSELEGDGMVLKKPMSVFYGTFQDGMPEGAGVSLQGIYLERMRYDYSEGMWEKGRMNGPGLVGYHYFQGIEGEENQAVQKEGTFTDDLMNGAFTYRTTNSEGETTTWDMEAEEGRTKLDDRWVYEEEKEEYALASDQNASHSYVISKQAVEEVLWRNMLLWSE